MIKTLYGTNILGHLSKLLKDDLFSIKYIGLPLGISLIMDSEPLLVKPYIPRSSRKTIIKLSPKQEEAQVYVAMGQKAVMSFCLLTGILQTAYSTTLMICTLNWLPTRLSGKESAC